jgi:hypothetical protein
MRHCNIVHALITLIYNKNMAEDSGDLPNGSSNTQSKSNNNSQNGNNNVPSSTASTVTMSPIEMKLKRATSSASNLKINSRGSDSQKK